LDEGNPTNQEGQNAEGQAAEKRDRQRECEQETGRDRPVEAPDDEPSQVGVGASPPPRPRARLPRQASPGVALEYTYHRATRW
jgi:hypothetical protein